MPRILHENDNDGSGPSGGVWYNCPWDKMLLNPNVGYTFWDDFLGFLEDTGGWAVGGTNQTAIVPADGVGGVIEVGCTGADNDDMGLSSGNNEGGHWVIDDTNPRELWFEARVKINNVTDVGHFIGLAEEGLAAADTLSNDDANLADKDFVGFHSDTAGPTALDSVYRMETGAATVNDAASQTMVAGTWYKLGLYYDEDDLHWFVDGVEVGTALDISDNTATFPDGEELCILFAMHDGEGAAKTMEIDWVRVAQRRELK